MALQQEQDWLSQVPTDVLIQITDYLTGYDKLCVRITCRRLYSILSDPRSWSSVIWQDCRRRDEDFKALRLALRLSRPCVKRILIMYNPDSLMFPLSKFVPQIQDCQVVRHLTLTGMPLTLSMLEKTLSKLPSLHFLSVSLGQKLNEQQILSATAKALNLQVVRISEISMRSFTYDWFGSFRIKRTTLYHAVILWKNNNYVPPNLELCVSSIPMEFLLEELTVSEHPAGLTIFPNCSAIAGNMIFKYPFFKVSLYPSVDIVTCPAQSVCSSHCGSFRFVLSPGQQPISAKVYMHSDTSSNLSTVPTLSFLPDSIKLVSLAGLRNFSSTDLALLSVSCPNLVCLDIHGCYDALLNLQGLADVASNCSRLVSLNLDYIDEVESVALFWEILGGMKKLRHLRLRGCLCAPDTSDELSGIDDEDWSPFDNRSRSRILASVTRLKLFALEINYDLTHVGDDVPLHFETLLPGLLWLQYLRITTGIQGKVNMTNILPYLPSLTHLAIVSLEDLPIVVLPTDSDCYVGLKKIVIVLPRADMVPKIKICSSCRSVSNFNTSLPKHSRVNSRYRTGSKQHSSAL